MNINPDLLRCQILKHFLAVNPVAIDLVIKNNADVQLFVTVLRVFEVKSESSNQELLLHRAVFGNDLHRVQSLLIAGNINVNEYDNHGNTPLNLACILGRSEIVDVLLRHGAIPVLRNNNYWTAFQEAVCYGNREILEKVWFANRKLTELNLRGRKLEILEELALKSADFYLNIHWQFSSWIPFTDRFCPVDNLIIYKKGSSIRVDFTLVGFENFSWKRGDCSLLFSIDPKTSKSTSFLLDNKRKYFQSLDDVLDGGESNKRERAKIAWKRFQSLDEKNENSDLEFTDWPAARENPVLHKILSGEIDMFMSNPVADSSSPGHLTFSQVKTGYFMFKKDLIEPIGDYDCRVFDVGNINLCVKKRTEHLNEEDLERLEKISSLFSKSEAKKEITKEEENDVIKDIESAKDLFDIRSSRQSIPPPPEVSVTFDDYQKNPKLVGRSQLLSQTDKTFEAKIWMADNFPLEIKDLIRLLSVVAPHHPSIEKLRRFISGSLPPGFPIQIQMPIFPTVKAEIRFEEYYERPQSAELFEVPSDYEENDLPDLMPNSE